MRALTALVTVAVALLVAVVPSALPVPAAPPRAEGLSAARTQFDIVFDKYLHGDADAAVEDVARWPEARIASEIPPLGKGEDARAMAALALLLTEAGARNGRLLWNVTNLNALAVSANKKGEWRQLPWPPGKGSDQEGYFLGRQNDLRRRVLSLDGFDAYARESSWLMRRAASVARARQDSEVLGVCHSWYILAIGLALQPQRSQAQGPLMRAALVDFGEDPQVLLAVASAMDAGVSRLVKLQDGAQPGKPWFSFAPTKPEKKTRHRDFTDVQLRAVPTLRRVLELDPSLVEARLRLGRLLYQLDAPADAQVELERALREARAARHVFAWYLAGLFLGELHEDAGRAGPAVAAYREAVAAIPSGLSARMALSHVLLTSGRVDEGWAAARGSFDNSDANRLADTDPWHLYPRAQAWQAASRLRTMREAVRR